MKRLFTFTLSIITCYSACGQIGIGTNDPKADLHVESGRVLFSAPVDYGGETRELGQEGRFFAWYPQKAALQIGQYTSTDWQKSVGQNSFAAGLNTWATGEQAFAGGWVSWAQGATSVALGYQSWARGAASVSIGDWVYTVGNGSAGLGKGLLVGSWGCTAVGVFNDFIEPISNTEWAATDPVFIVGNGSSENSRSNGLVMLKNGNAGIGTDAPAQKLEVAGVVKSDGITLPSSGGTSAVLSHYEEFDMQTTIHSSTTVFVENYTVRLARVGKVVTVTLPTSPDGFDARQRDIRFNALPETFRPSGRLTFLMQTVSGGRWKIGMLEIVPDGTMLIRPDLVEDVWGGPNSGFRATSVSYVVE